jgi:hypothetical protein
MDKRGAKVMSKITYDTEIKKVKVNGMTFYKVDRIKNELFQTKASAKKALYEDVGFKSRSEYRHFVLGD